MHYLIYAASLALVLSSCSKSGTKAPDNSPVQQNVAYGDDPKQKMDLYFPANRSRDSTKLAILIHGGTWTSGDKSDLNIYLEEIRKRLPDYAFANLNYRLATVTVNKFPTQENDILKAVSFLKSKTADYNISEKFVLIGASAGAHLALLQGYKHRDLVRPQAIVSLFGPTDLIDLYNHPINPATQVLLQVVTNSVPSTNPDIYRESSPLNYALSGAPPTLQLYGAKDSIVPANQINLLKHRLDSLSVPNVLKIYADAGHGFFTDNLYDSYEQIVAFLKTYVN